MKNPIFTGAAVAIVTPMHKDGSINHEKMGELIDWQIDAGTDAIVVCGTTGESPVLTHDEHCGLIRYAVERVAGRAPVIAGTGSNDTAYALELSQEAASAGADALLMVTPYYNKTSQRGLIQHYIYVADRVDKPIMLYNVPSRTGLDIKPETYRVLSGHPMITAAKEANGDMSALARTRELCGDDLTIYSGNDDQIVPVMALGGKGVVSVLSNIIPKETHEITAACLRGDFVAGSELQIKYLTLANVLFCDVSPIPVKEALNLMGHDVGSCRPPLYDMDSASRDTLVRALEQYSLI